MLNPGVYLTPSERKELSTKSNFKGWLEVLHTWGWIAFAFALVGFFPNILTIIIALFIIGGKQLGCAIIMHDAGHYAIFKEKSSNDFVGKWLASYPILNDVMKYRPYHLQHHLTTGSSEDPDISLTKGYPASMKSMLRKFARDLFGATGIKAQIGMLSMHLGYLKYSLSREIQKLNQSERTWGAFFKVTWQNLHGPILSNLMLFGILWAFGQPYLYLLWIGALLTTFNFCLRVRSMAEHAMVDDMTDLYRNTRTTKANWLERMLFAPHHVNYHAEHHLMMGVPSYNLPKMHQLLIERGFYDKGLLETGYWNIVKQAMSLKK